jgi:LuxR family maltose regulon positive regulatory protein
MDSYASSDQPFIPSNKFYPPHVNQAQSLLREAILENKLSGREQQKKVIILEAQAGQGKTTLASQFLTVNNIDFTWYQMGPEDSDPFFLLSALTTSLSRKLPNFASPKLASTLNAGSAGPLDLIRCAEMLLVNIREHVQSDLYLVFDDLHLIDESALTHQLFAHIIDNSPPQLHFLLITRHPLTIKAKTIRNGNEVAYLNTFDLALNDLEIETLYNSVLGRTISRQDAMRIQKMTNGWIMGIILASHPISGRPKFWLDNDADSISTCNKTGHMLDYFEEEIFAQIPEQLHLPFLKLSFLQEIPVDLGTIICDLVDLGDLLDELTRENYFIYHLDDNRQTYRFHHFFQEFLQQRARQRLTAAEIAEIYSREASYYLDLDQTEKALICYKNGSDYGAMETILKDRGMDLIVRNRTLSILNLLRTIPDETLHQHRWLTLYAGLLRIDYIPQTTLPFFQLVQKQFADHGEDGGELIALSQMIYYHFVISGKYKVGAELLSRTETLLERNKNTLPIPIVIVAARNLASGYCFFVADMDKARHYITLATTLSTRHDIRNFTASSRFILGYIELLCGNRAKYLREAEACFSMFHDPLVGESNRLTMRVMNLCYLSMTGDHLNYQLQQQALQQSIDQNVVDQTVAAPYLYIWGSSALFSIGQTQQALELLDRGSNITTTAASAHMNSQVLQWQAFGLAISGDKGLAEEKIKVAGQLREAAGGPFYESFHYIMAGAVFTRTGEFHLAEEHLLKGQALAKKIPSTYLIMCALFNLSYCRLLAHGTDSALADLEAGLSCMKINGYNHFWSWEPEMMAKLLAQAVERDIETSFAQDLARSRLHVNFGEDGTPIPLLKFTLMDHFEISMAGKVVLPAKDLTPFQRELLGLLITAKGQRIPQEKIQLELWPDSSPDNARKSFDTLLTRLRKIISPHLSLPIKTYLSLQKSILCLTNYSIDALQFMEDSRTGLAHSKNSDWWQAYNSFQSALSLWKGAMPEDTFQSEQIFRFNDTLASLLSEIGMVWATNLAKSGQTEEAVSLLERVLRINYLDEDLTILLYQLYHKNNQPLSANETLGRYRKALIRAEYTEEEAESYIADIMASMIN